MKLKDLMEKYGEYEVNSKIITEECEIERIVIDLTKPKPQSVWDLKSCDKYFLLYADGVVTEYEWRGNGYISQNYRDQGNIFITKEEAKKDAERREVETLLLKFGGRRWFKEGTENYYLNYSHELELDCSCRNYIVGQGSIYFDGRSEIQNAINEIGKERIVKALFEVR